MDTLTIIGLILVILGVIGSIVPVMPGPILSFAGLALLHISKGPETISLFLLTIFGLITFLLTIIVYLAPILGAKFSGSSKKGFLGSIVGAIAGIILLPPLGFFLGAFVGAILGEVYGGKDFDKAVKAGIGVVVGSATVAILQFIFSLIVMVYFFIKLV